MSQMYTHELNPLKGWPDEHALDFAADAIIDDGDVIRGGMVMSLNEDGNFEKGLACGAVAIFSLQNSTDFDVVGDTGNLVGNGNGGVGNATPRMSGLVALGPYELQSTEFDTTFAAMYVPNQALTSPAPGQAGAGLLRPGTAYTDTVCGVCSLGLVTNENQIQVVQFWSAWLPAVNCPEESSSSVAP